MTVGPPATGEPATGVHGDAPPATAPSEPPAPADGLHRFPIVGIGASAGGLAAFEAFFSAMPADTDPGMAFVLVQHLAPDHKSILAELVRRYTRMRVFEVEDGMAVEPNCTYIIPPNRDMAFLNGTLQLLDPSAPRGQRLPIDFFFRSLAQDQHERAIGIILSGGGSDGTLGVRAIKGEGGFVLAQTPDSTEFDSMPRSAIATGLVDCVLTPSEMPARLLGYAANLASRARSVAAASAPAVESAMRKIFVLLRSQTGHDFSQYKPSTMNRRVERRMAVHHVDTVEEYVRLLQQSPTEVAALFSDMLIGVTNFFRDPDAFRALEEQVIPSLFEGKPAGAPIRVWTPGCSTGEEAYSIAMLLIERMETARCNFAVQVFATDIDSQAIAIARAGLYPASVAADVSPERLSRFFTREADGSAYRVQKSLRDLLVFSEQDVIRDPPFSKLDLITCRNLLIYLGPELQRRIIPLFHYALRPGGSLFLGTSEGIGEFDALFTPLDRKAKLFRRSESSLGATGHLLGRFAPSITMPDAGLPHGTAREAGKAKRSVRELTEQALLQQVVPSGALVNAQGDVLYLHGRTGMYLEPAPGEAGVSNILKMAREGLRTPLATALHTAVSTRDTVRSFGLRVRTNGHFASINLTIRPLTGGSPESPMFLVVFEETSAAPERGAAKDDLSPAAGAHDPATDAEARIASLLLELRARDECLQSTHEELESANEELKSSNEEMQSVNEELQSANEELETSKEELQSVNEELTTVNTELQTKVHDLSRANNDMNNLLAGTGIGTVFVDHQLRILRFTPAASAIINLILSDVGRPVAHIVSNLVGYGTLVADVQSVLDTLQPKEIEVAAIDGRTYTMRIQPYRTLTNVIEGAVISFIDVTAMKQVREELGRANDLLRLAVAVRDAGDAIIVQDLEGATLAWNPAASRIYGWSEAEALTMNMRDRIPAPLRQEAQATLASLVRGGSFEPRRAQRLTKDGATVDVSVVASGLVNGAGRTYAVSMTERLLQRGTP